MLDYARHDAAMERPAEKGSSFTVRAHLEALAARGRESAVRELDGPELPEALAYLWDWFQELQRARTCDGMSGQPVPFTYPQIEAWSRLMQRTPSPDEVQVLLSMDLVTRHPDLGGDS